MHYIIYETTNKVNGKKYRGVHICDFLQDKYIGSGRLLKKAIAKYGFENFERKIIKECDSVEEMFIQEAIFVDKSWVENVNTYNLKIGGEGGWDYINKEGLRWNEEKRKLHSIEMKKKREFGEWGPKHPTCGFRGKSHSSESKNKISENNAMLLDKAEINKRIEQWKLLPDTRGKISRISKMWNVSHTQVRRFIEKYNLRVA